MSVTIDGDALGMTSSVHALVPPVEGLQDATEVDLAQVRVPANQRLFVIVRP